MAGSITTDIGKRGGGPPAASQHGGDGDGSSRGASRRASLTGLLVLLAASTMLFAAFTSAFVVRRGLSDDWIPLSLPRIVWVNTAVLIASGVAVEFARRALRSGRRMDFNHYWTAGTALGLVFLVGQFLAWRQLRSQGIFLATNPSSSFFYLLTAAHALHLIGGVMALLYVNLEAVRLQLGPGKRTAVDVSALFWHFLDVLWVYLVVLFSVWG